MSLVEEVSVDSESVADGEAIGIFECIFLSDSEADSEKKLIWNYFQTLQRVIKYSKQYNFVYVYIYVCCSLGFPLCMYICMLFFHYVNNIK